MVGTVVKAEVSDLEEEIRGEGVDEVQEGYNWCGAGCCQEKEVFSEVPRWVGEGDVVKLAHHCGCQE